jgi:hypothetical protein
MSNDLRSLRGCAAGRPIIFNPSIFRLLHRQIHLLPYITSSQTLFLLFGETFKYNASLICLEKPYKIRRSNATHSFIVKILKILQFNSKILFL